MDTLAIEPLTVPTMAELACWPQEEIFDWLYALEDDERVSDADFARARTAVHTFLGID